MVFSIRVAGRIVYSNATRGNFSRPTGKNKNNFSQLSHSLCFVYTTNIISSDRTE